jgi:hypothetical protein
VEPPFWPGSPPTRAGPGPVWASVSG